MKGEKDNDAERDGAPFLVLFLLSWIPFIFLGTTLGDAFAATVAPAMILIAWEVRWEKKHWPFQLGYVAFGLATIIALFLLGPKTEDFRGQTTGGFLIGYGAVVYLAVKYLIKPKDRINGHANQ